MKTITVNRSANRFVTIAGKRHTVIGVRANELLVRDGAGVKWINPKQVKLDNLMTKCFGALALSSWPEVS